MTFQSNTGTRKALFSATESTVKGDEWETPQSFFDALNAEFHFTLDAAASNENAKCSNWITKERNSLTLPWDRISGRGAIWCNPPYGRDIGLWLRKGRMEADAGCTVVFLVHARTDTRWFHEHV